MGRGVPLVQDALRGGTLAADGVIEVNGDLGVFKDAYKERFQGVEAKKYFVFLVLSARSPLFRPAFLRVMGNGSRLCSSGCDSAPLFCSPTSQATSTPPLPFFSPTRHTQ